VLFIEERTSVSIQRSPCYEHLYLKIDSIADPKLNTIDVLWPMPLRMASADPTRRFASDDVTACHDHLESPWW
jgi:hypothetical protein